RILRVPRSLRSRLLSSFSSRYGAHPALPSFPTRRSSDLGRALAGQSRAALGDAPEDEALGELRDGAVVLEVQRCGVERVRVVARSEEHTSELQSRENLVCRLLLEKKKQDSTQALQSHGDA